MPFVIWESCFVPGELADATFNDPDPSGQVRKVIMRTILQSQRIRFVEQEKFAPADGTKD
ncbi:hypothetical protein KFU94_17310 [Chloroflexi bacterium TSY]|nr:hypothetical protein [Chloroflexi bacterium TSY]